MPRLEPKSGEQTEWVVCVESFSAGHRVTRGELYDRNHWLCKAHPQFFRLLGPRLDEAEEVSRDAA